ncbi:MAG: hypothetical protein ACLFQV_13315 [Vulcanimicrobiota bacterium]
MKKMFIVGIVLLALMLTLSCNPANREASAQNNSVEDSQQLIKSLNLINSLYLSDEQIHQLLPLLSKAENLELQLEKVENDEKNLAGVLSQIQLQLQTNTDIHEKLKKEYHEKSLPIKRQRVKIEEEKKNLILQAYNVLNENQKVLLEGYQPCIVPQRSVANPERIGQEGGSDKIQKGLEKIRKLTPEQYKKIKPVALDKI